MIFCIYDWYWCWVFKVETGMDIGLLLLLLHILRRHHFWCFLGLLQVRLLGHSSAWGLDAVGFSCRIFMFNDQLGARVRLGEAPIIFQI